MNREDRDVRLQIMLQPQELRAIEEWRFTKRMPAGRPPCANCCGLAAEGFAVAPDGKQSGDFGVTGMKRPTNGA